jgi:GNAT superfamily N-acetyltransferase
VGWIAEQNATPIGMAMLLLRDHPPRPTGEARRGYVTSVYVMPQHRRQGVGRALMEAVIAYGREEGLQRLELRTSEQGRVLYERVGFTPQEVMMLRLDEGQGR